MEKIYYVSFFKNLVDSNGHPFTPCQGAVEVRATGQDRAIELARQRFAKLKNVADWSMRADYEMVELLASRKRLSQRVRRDQDDGATGGAPGIRLTIGVVPCLKSGDSRFALA
jgi:hypothetical protein